MAMKMKGIYKSFKSISLIFVVKERDMELGSQQKLNMWPMLVGRGSSGSATAWRSDFKAGTELLSPRASSFTHATHNSFFNSSASSDFDEDSSQVTISDRQRDVPPIPVDLSKIHTKSKNKRNKSFSTSSPRSKLSPKSSKLPTGLSKGSYKSTVFRLNSNA